MNRAFARPSTGVALATLLLVFGAAPSVSAGPLRMPSGSLERAGWVTTAWAWLGDYLGWNHHNTVVPPAPSQATDKGEMTRSFGATGSCIDPFGRIIPCANGLLKPPGSGILPGPLVVPVS